MSDTIDPAERAAALREDRSNGWTLLAVLAAGAVPASGIGLVLPFGLDACEGACTQITVPRFYAGWGLTVAGHWLVILIAVCWMSTRAARGRLIWWIPLAAGAACATTWLAGWWLALATVPL